MSITTKTTLWLLLALGAAACDEGASEPLLDRERVLAVRVSPPSLEAEESGAIDVLVGRADGSIDVVAPAAVAVDLPGGDAGGRMVTGGAQGWTVTCPPAEALAELRAQSGLPEDAPVVVPLAIEVEVDGVTLAAGKSVLLGADGDNPTLAGLAVDADEADDGALVVERDAEVAIAAEGAAVDDGEPAYAWYTSVGDIDLYRSESAVMTAGDPGRGPLVLVLRDDHGGVTWTWRDVRVE
ncbi:MAG TPA: hypothetical protein VMZ28_02255 [Kofleriaceae bacterium]|nr:hypothetical protein [Kofleriaceae bacterium]